MDGPKPDQIRVGSLSTGKYGLSNITAGMEYQNGKITLILLTATMRFQAPSPWSDSEKGIKIRNRR
jgi:hypothetical protein